MDRRPKKSATRKLPPRRLVYFIFARDLGMVKIGKTTDGVTNRLRALQTSCPADLTCIGTIDARHYDTERLAHQFFASLRVRGEWFRMDESIAVFLERFSNYAGRIPPDGGGAAEYLRDWKRDRAERELDEWLATIPGVGPNFPFEVAVLDPPPRQNVPPRLSRFATQAEQEDEFRKRFGMT